MENLKKNRMATSKRKQIGSKPKNKRNSQKRIKQIEENIKILKKLEPCIIECDIMPYLKNKL